MALSRLLLILLCLVFSFMSPGFAERADSRLKLAPHPAPGSSASRMGIPKGRGMPGANAVNVGSKGHGANGGTQSRKDADALATGIERADVYGIVISVKKLGPAPGSVAITEQGAVTGAGQSSLNPKNSQGAISPNSLVAGLAGAEETVQKVTVRLDIESRIQGLRNQVVTVDNIVGDNPAYNISLKPGVRVLLDMERHPGTGQWTFHIANRDRTPALLILGTLFVLGVLIIGGPEVSKHMLLALVMLMGTYQALFPAVLAGSGGMLWALLMIFVFTILGSFIYQVPGTKAFSREQSIVILGTLGGLLILGLLMWLMHELMPLSGYSSEGLAGLWYQSPKMDYWALFMATVLVGMQGFVFYLCWQLAQNRKQEGEVLDFRQRCGIVLLRGRRLLGPLLSSLALLFLGLFMPVLLQLQGTSTAQFINQESTASMLAYAFAAGLTLILTVPLVALIAAWVLTGKPAVNR